MVERTSPATAEEWFERSEALIRHALRRYVVRAEDIEDLAQEVYLRLLRVPRLDLVRHPQAYLYRVAINVTLEWRLRAQQSKDHSAEWLEVLPAEGHDPENEADQSERDRMVRQMLAALPVGYRTAVILHAYEGMTYEQVAEHMGISRRAVKRYMAKGYVELRKRLATCKTRQYPVGKVHDTK